MATQTIPSHAKLIPRMTSLDSYHTSTLKRKRKPMAQSLLLRARLTSLTDSACSSSLASIWASHKWWLESSPSCSTVQAQASRDSLLAVTNSLGSSCSGTGSGAFLCDSRSQEERARVTTWRTGDKRCTSSMSKAYSCGLLAWLLLSFTCSLDWTGWSKRATDLSKPAAKVRWNCMRLSEA